MANDKKDERKPETPEDVAALYAWANVHNVKYRDFSADRREHRAQQQMQRPIARSETPAPVRPPPIARPMPQRAPSVPGQLEDPYSSPDRRSLEDIKRPAALTQMQASRMSAGRDAGVTRLNLDAVRPIAAPFTGQTVASFEGSRDNDESANVLRPTHQSYPSYPTAPALRPSVSPPAQPQPVPRPPAAPPQMERAVPPPTPPPTEQFAPPPRTAQSQPFSPPRPAPVFRPAEPAPVAQPATPPVAPATSWRYSDPSPEEFEPTQEVLESVDEDDFVAPADRPAWLYQEPATRQTSAQPQAAAPDTLIDTRERVASRWFALRGVFNAPDESNVRPQEFRTPVAAVFSLAGGVGKTSLVATLGRALSALGEHVLLADTTSYGLLPFYYGARELRPGIVRTFNPPPSTSDSPVNMVSYEPEAQPADNEHDRVMAELAEAGRSANRVLVDLATASSAMAKRILRLGPTVIVPIVPDMSSVIGLAAVEQFFRNHRAGNGQTVQPCYVLNQFDAAQPLHLDVREVLRQQLGDRLLPIVLRRSQAVSEALAEGMTVMDYAPKSGIADDYAALANWLRNLHAPAQQAFRAMRWSEQ